MATPDILMAHEIPIANDGFSRDAEGTLEGTRKFLVKVATTLSSETTLINQVFEALPANGAVHPRCSTIFVDFTSVAMTGADNRTYEATVKYKTRINTSKGNPQEINLPPWQQSPKLAVVGGQNIEQVVRLAYMHFGFGKYSKFWNASGKFLPSADEGGASADGSYPIYSIVNSALDPFKDPPTEPEAVTAFRITYAKRYSDVPLSAFVNMKNCLNNAEITIAGVTIPKWCGLISDINAELAYYNKSEDSTNFVQYWQISVDIQYRPASWSRWLRDVGFRNRLMIEGKIVYSDILADNERIQEPVPLFGEGFHNPANVTSNPLDDIGVMFMTKKVVDWSVLKLPSAIASQGS